MKAYNYTSVKLREKKTYTLFNTTISQEGLSMGALKLSALMFVPFTLIGILICIITGTIWYNPMLFMEKQVAGYFLVIFILCPIALGFFLNGYKVQQYRLWDYLIMYFTPKHPVNEQGKKIKYTEYKEDSYIERI